MYEIFCGIRMMSKKKRVFLSCTKYKQNYFTAIDCIGKNKYHFGMHAILHPTKTLYEHQL